VDSSSHLSAGLLFCSAAGPCPHLKVVSSGSSPLAGDGDGDDDDSTVLLCESDSSASLCDDIERPRPQSSEPEQDLDHDTAPSSSANSSLTPPSYLNLRSLWQGKESRQGGAYAALSSLEDGEEQLDARL
jgi:hypothetical protein